MANLREIIDYSKNNPDSDYARQALQNLQSGKWDQKAKEEGIDLSFVGRANYAQPEPDVMASDKMSLKDRLGQAFNAGKEIVKDAPSDFMEMGKKLSSGLAETGQNIVQKATKEDRTLAEKATMVGGEAFKGTVGFVGNALMGLGKLALPQSLETKIAQGVDELGPKIAQASLDFVERVKASEHPWDQKAVAKLEELVDRYKTDERFRDQVDAGSGFAQGAMELFGVGKGVSILKEGAEATIDTAVDVTKQVAPKVKDAVVDATGKTIEVASDVARGTGQAVKGIAPDTTGMSESIIASVNKINPTKRIEFRQMAGKSEEEWLRERGIIGTRETTVQALAENFQTLRKNVDDALDKMPGTYRDTRITTVADEAAEIAKNTESPETQAMVQLAEKAKGVGLTPKEINELKRFYERNVKVGYMKDPTKTSEQVQRATNRDSALRGYLFEVADKNGFGNLRELNKEIQANKYLADEIAGKMEGQQSNNIMGLTDWIVATPGIAIDPKFLGAFGLKKIVSSEGFKSFMAKALAGFPERKPLPRADLDEIEKRASELLKREEDLRVETEKSAVFADEILKAGYTMSEGPRGFITKNKLADIIDMPLTKQEQAMLRAGERQETYEQVVQYIIEARENGQVVGDGFVMMPAEPKYLELPERAGAIELTDGAKAGTEKLKDNLPKIALGAGGAYYLSEQEDGSMAFPTAALVAMGTMKPNAAVDALNEAWKTTMRNRNRLVKVEGLSENHPSVKQADRALDAIEKERNKQNSR